jgi:hypothetical protein
MAAVQGETTAPENVAQRYAMATSRSIELDRVGFLDDEHVRRPWVDPTTGPVLVSDLVERQRSFAILAPGGVGKSTAFLTLREMESDATNIDLRVLGKSEMIQAINEAVSLRQPVYLDSLDEAALLEPAVFRVLESALQQHGAKDLRWRFACRPAAWPPGFSTSLRSLPQFEEYRLLPLTRAAAALVVQSTGVDSDEFIEALIAAKLGRLAASPMQLRAAALQWKQTGQLPTSHVESIRYEIRGLLKETDADRPQMTIGADDQYRIARRLGAISAFCGVSRFARLPDQAENVLSVTDVPSNPEPESPGRTIDADQYREVLSTALFDAAPAATVSFRHQQYAEFLAAEYVVQQEIGSAQLSTLLGIHKNGLLPGTMVGVATWISALDPNLIANIISANALGFAQTGIELPIDTLRETVVGGLLSAAAAGELDPRWSLDLSGLAHDSLPNQLRTALNTGLQQSEQVWWISRLARDGQVADLASELVELALDARWDSWARRAAIGAVDELGTDQQRLTLLPLLNLQSHEDPDDELLAGALEVLYPRLIDTGQLLDALRPRRSRNFIGAYRMFLAELPNRIPDHDLPAVLRWASVFYIDREYDALDNLPTDLLIRAWEAASVMAALGELVAAFCKRHDMGHGTLRDVPWRAGDTSLRRQLAVEVAARGDDVAWYRILQLGLLDADDALWLLDALANMPEAARAVLLKCVPSLVRDPSAAVADRLLSLDQDHVAYRVTAHLRGIIELDSVEAEQGREMTALSSETMETEPSIDERRAQLVDAIERATADIDTWWQIAYLLSVEGRDHDVSLFAMDLTSRPGWTDLTPSERVQVLQLGLQYVHTHVPQTSTWLGKPTLTGNVPIADCSGVYLLTTLARHTPELIQDLDRQTWSRWVTAIVGAWDFQPNGDSGLRTQLLAFAPDDVQPLIREALMENLRARSENNQPLSPRDLYAARWPEVGDEISDLLTRGELADESARSVLALVIDSSSSAPFVCRTILDGPLSSLHGLARRGLARHAPAEMVDRLVNDSAATDIFADVATHLDVSALPLTQLTVFAASLLDRYPFASDPPLPQSSFGSSTHDEDARRVRSHVLDRLAQLGAVDELIGLMNERGPAEGRIIGRYLRAAREQAADLTYIRPTAAALIEIASSSDVRLVRDDEDLAGVLINMLDNLQIEVAQQGAYRDLWNIGVGGEDRPKSEDDISDWIRRQLTTRLARGGAVDRELQVLRRTQSGVGTRIDLTATSPTRANELARVVVEAKLVGNRSLMTAMQDQLVEQYLKPLGLRYGIYLVYWVQPDQRPSNWPVTIGAQREDLMSDLATQAETIVSRDGCRVTSFILDISKPRV